MARVFPHVFYLLLTSPVLSPSIGGVSIYLFVIVPLIDPNFIRYLLALPVDRKYVIAFFLLAGASTPYGSAVFLFKVLTIFVTVAYMVFTVRSGTFCLFQYMCLNVLVAAIQFFGTVVLKQAILFPDDVGKFLYGRYSLETGVTGAEGYLLNVRFSGLSREPGFFSSLLIASLLLLTGDRDLPHRRFLIGIHVVGIVLGFSKISLVFLPVFAIAYLLRKYVDLVPRWLVVLGSLSVMVLGTLYLYERKGFDFLDLSLRHRTIGYAILADLDWKDLLFGVGFRNVASRAGDIPLIAHSEWFAKMPGAVAGGSGLSSVLIDHGVLYLLVLIFLLYLLEVPSYELLLFLAFTVNDNPLTSSSFIMIGIYYLLFNRAHNLERKEGVRRLWGAGFRRFAVPGIA